MSIECPGCHQTVDQLYQPVANLKENVCLRCLTNTLWQQGQSDSQDSELRYTITAGSDTEHFLSGLTEELKVDDQLTLYRQRRSNNIIIVSRPSANSDLQCLDVTIAINKA